MKLVIHDWDNASAVRILRNCYDAMLPHAKLLVVDSVISPDDDLDVGKFSDLEMLVLSHGGRERTEEEFRGLYEQAGFELTRIVPTKSRRCVIEGIRR